ncbi:sigma-70 family RNA polymerase sigma factor [Streptosporangium sp. NPDC051023]|uniref:RNA polymerase sigma factor n=1 Tax=Streptosporangium sp. NPDC051023 TaxID=3155410 RepID=UPI00344EA9ED
MSLVADEELVRRAQAGEVTALGALLARHEAPMRAVALTLLGPGPDADDVVQDAALAALRRIGDVRDPAAAGAWLRAIVRNGARMRLRGPREIPVDGRALLLPRPSDAEQAIEAHAMRDWIWDALEELPAPLRLMVMLRHFSGISSYQGIAEACQIPIGTVRSRLHQARTRLARLLLDNASRAHGDASWLARDSAGEALETLRGAEQGTYSREILELWPRQARLIGVLAPPGEDVHPIPVMAKATEEGVVQRLRQVTASRDITIWEMNVTGPDDGFGPMVPTLAWIMFRADRRVHRLRVVFPRPLRGWKPPAST